MNNFSGLDTRVLTDELEPIFSFFEPDSYSDHNIFLNNNINQNVLFRY